MFSMKNAIRAVAIAFVLTNGFMFAVDKRSIRRR